MSINSSEYIVAIIKYDQFAGSFWFQNEILPLSTKFYPTWQSFIGRLYEGHCMKSVQIRSYFWSVLSCIRTEYGDLLRKSLYSYQIQENTDQK